MGFSCLGPPLFGLQLCWASALVGFSTAGLQLFVLQFHLFAELQLFWASALVCFSIAGLQLFGLQFHSSAALWASALFGFSFFGFGLLGFISLGFGSVGLRLFGPYLCRALALWLQVCQASAHLGFSPVGFRRLMPKRRNPKVPKPETGIDARAKRVQGNDIAH